MESISFLAAFGAGILIFLSPCIFPLIPGYISYLTGVSFKEFSGEITDERKKDVKRLTVLHSLSFVLGFSIIFIALGATATILGKALLEHHIILRKIGGAIIILFGLIIMGVIKIPFMQREKKLSYKKHGISVLGSILVGATFALAWTPCVGPVLGGILVYASSTASVKEGIKLLFAFSLGLGIPFILSAILINSFLTFIKKIEKYLKYVNIGAGLVLLVFGILLLIGRSTI